MGVVITRYPVINQYCVEHKLSLRGLARQCGIPVATLYRNLYGETEFMKHTIDKLIKGTGLTYEQLFVEDPRWQKI